MGAGQLYARLGGNWRRKPVVRKVHVCAGERAPGVAECERSRPDYAAEHGWGAEFAFFVEKVSGFATGGRKSI